MSVMELRLRSSVRARHGEIPAELASALARRGIEAVAAPDGTITFPGVDGDVRLRLTDDGATLDVRGPETVDEHNEAGWIAHNVLAPLVEALLPERVGDWITDRWARQPSGGAACEGYRDPTHHRPSFGAILSAIQGGGDGPQAAAFPCARAGARAHPSGSSRSSRSNPERRRPRRRNRADE